MVLFISRHEDRYDSVAETVLELVLRVNVESSLGRSAICLINDWKATCLSGALTN